MNRFSYARATDVDGAVREKCAAGVKFVAGGTNLVDLIKYNVERPQRLVDITHVPMRQIADTPDGGLRIGALVTNATTAYDERIVARYPLLANAILSGVAAIAQRRDHGRQSHAAYALLLFL